MRTSLRIFLLTGLVTLISLGARQAEPLTLTDAELTPMVGSWAGSLTYTNYRDDRTQVTLTTRCAIRREKKTGLRLDYTYVEPNGKEMQDVSVFKPAKTPGRVSFGGEWEVKEKQATATTLYLVIEGVGQDNNKPSTIREIIRVTADSLTHEKQVKYDGSADFFRRNRYAFARQPQ